MKPWSRFLRRVGRILFFAIMIVLALAPIPILPFVVKKSWLRRRRETADHVMPQ